MKLTATSSFDEDSLARGRYWHWHRNRWQIFVSPILGIFVATMAIFLFQSSSFLALPLVLLAMAFSMIFHYWIQGYKFRRSIRRNPQYRCLIHWNFSQEGIERSSKDFNSRFDWPCIYKSYTTPDGFLLHPQKEIYYWIPREAFSPQSDPSALEEWLAESTTNKILG